MAVSWVERWAVIKAAETDDETVEWTADQSGSTMVAKMVCS